MTHSGSILFDIDLNNLNYTKINRNIVLSFDKLQVENVFSLKNGPVFKIYNMDNERINIMNSEFRRFKSGSGE